MLLEPLPHYVWVVAEHVGVQIERAAATKSARVEIGNYRAIETLDMPLHPGLSFYAAKCTVRLPSAA